jgi:cell division protein FtsL
MRKQRKFRQQPTLKGVFQQWLMPLAFGALFSVLGVVHVASRVTVVSSGYEVSQLGHQNRSLMQENDRLKLELATLKSPARLEKLARDKLGMAPVPAGAMVLMGGASPAAGHAERRAMDSAALARADLESLER